MGNTDKDDLLADLLKMVEAVLRGYAEKVDERERRVSVDEFVVGAWSLLESGQLKLVDRGKYFDVRPTGNNRAERRAATKRNRPLVEYRRRTLQ